MPDYQPQYRFRGSVKPSAEVSRPVAARRNAAPAGGSTSAGSSATLDIFDVIDSYGGWFGISARDVDAALKQIGDVDTLFVRLNSPGGEATEGVAIANLLRAHKANVRVTVYGMAASAASYIAIAGDVVSMGPGSLMFVHDAINIIYGDAADLRKEAETLDTLSDSIAGLYVLKAGGDTAQWRAAMHADTWYSAESAVAAKLADRIGLDPQMPTDLPPVEDDADDDAPAIEIDVEISPAARAAARRFDLSMLPNAPAALAPQAPAVQPVAPSTDPKEADAMSDTLLDGLRKQLGLSDDADEATVLAANAEALTEAAEPVAEVTPAAVAKAYGITAEQAKAALDGAKAGKVTVSQAMLDSLKAGADAGQAALARQRTEDRDKAIAKAQDTGKVGRGESEVKAWQAAYDRDPEGTARELDELGVRFPVAKAPAGYAGEPSQRGDVMTEAEAKIVAAQTGVDYKELMSA